MRDDGPKPRKPSILFIVRGNETVPSCRFRAYQYGDPLRALGIDVEYVILEKSKNPFRQILFHLKLIPILRRHDAVIFQKLLEPRRLRFLRLFNENLFYDFDDAMYAGPGGERFAATVKAAPRVIAGNETLAARARTHNPNVEIIPTTIPIPHDLAPPEKNDVFTLSWIGTSANLPYLQPVIDALDELKEEGETFALSILTEKPERAPERAWIRAAAWSRTREEEDFRSCDVGLMPLEDTEWCAGKCACKALQYLSYGKPVISSPVGMNRDLFEGSSFGILATGKEEWKRAIKTYFSDPAGRRAAGAEGRAHAVERYDVTLWAKKLAAIVLG